jgi:hypothetical protein
MVGEGKVSSPTTSRSDRRLRKPSLPTTANIMGRICFALGFVFPVAMTRAFQKMPAMIDFNEV